MEERKAPEPVVDVDRHVQETWSIFQEFAEPEFRDRVYRKVTRQDGSPGMTIDGRPVPFSAAMWDDPHANQMFEDGRFSPNSPRATALDPHGYLRAMDKEGIDAALITPTLAMGNYSVPDGQLGSALSRAYGRWAREFCSVAPDRLLPLYPVNLYDLDQAVKDARWAVEQMGFRGFQLIALPVGTTPLHDPCLDPFWQVVQEAAVPLQIHTLSSLPDANGRGPLVDLAPGVSQFGGNLCLHHLVSHRLEQHLALASIVIGGVLARFPGLRFVFVEAGAGWIASWLEEMDNHYEPPAMRRWLPWLSMHPGEYFRRQCLAAFQADEQCIEAVAPLIGHENVAWSSDYPHHDGVFPGAVVAVRRQISAWQGRHQAGLLGGNARRICGLD